MRSQIERYLIDDAKLTEQMPTADEIREMLANA